MDYFEKKVDLLNVTVSATREDLGKRAALDVSAKIKEIIEQNGSVRIIFASAASQLEFLNHLKTDPDIDWSKVTAFQQDEWAGVPVDDPRSFSRFMREHLFNSVKPGNVFYLDGSADPDFECERYGALLMQEPIDIIILGIGENGHIAFIEPHEADFSDARMMKKITLDDVCRQQQFHDFGFASIEDVPEYGLTITIPLIMKAAHIFVVVPGQRKALAVKHTLEWEVSERCPATILRTASNATLYLDKDSAALAESLN